MRTNPSRSILSKALSLIILLSFIGFGAALFTTMHVHVNGNGQITVHCHPLSGAGEGKSNGVHHSHANTEFVFLKHSITILTQIILVLYLLYIISLSIRIFSSDFENPKFVDKHNRTWSNRAPPSLSCR